MRLPLRSALTLIALFLPLSGPQAGDDYQETITVSRNAGESAADSSPTVTAMRCFPPSATVA
jgi:hypothetical protein